MIAPTPTVAPWPRLCGGALGLAASALTLALFCACVNDPQADFFFDEEPIASPGATACGKLNNIMVRNEEAHSYADIVIVTADGSKRRFVREVCWPWCGDCDGHRSLAEGLKPGVTHCLRQRARYNPFCNAFRATQAAERVEASASP